jgi:hypothetical protein
VPLRVPGAGPGSVPTVLRIGGARFHFYSGDRGERPHIHVENGEGSAKFWLDPVSLAKSYRFRWRELHRLRRVVIEHEAEFLEAWHEFFET